MKRRSFLLSLPVSLALAQGAGAQTDPLATAFARLPAAARRAAQERLLGAGFYSGAVDGKFGRGTAFGLAQAAIFITDNSYGKVRFDLTTPRGAETFLSALAGGQLDKYLWGEGDEADGG